MPTRTVTVGSPAGLHARPASEISKAATDLNTTVFIARQAKPESTPPASSRS